MDFAEKCTTQMNACDSPVHELNQSAFSKIKSSVIEFQCYANFELYLPHKVYSSGGREEGKVNVCRCDEEVHVHVPFYNFAKCAGVTVNRRQNISTDHVLATVWLFCLQFSVCAGLRFHSIFGCSP